MLRNHGNAGLVFCEIQQHLFFVCMFFFFNFELNLSILFDQTIWFIKKICINFEKGGW
jgi:hypothetical protein